MQKYEKPTNEEHFENLFSAFQHFNSSLSSRNRAIKWVLIKMNEHMYKYIVQEIMRRTSAESCLFPIAYDKSEIVLTGCNYKGSC